jgi:hypothetical protein
MGDFRGGSTINGKPAITNAGNTLNYLPKLNKNNTIVNSIIEDKDTKLNIYGNIDMQNNNITNLNEVRFNGGDDYIITCDNDDNTGIKWDDDQHEWEFRYNNSVGAYIQFDTGKIWSKGNIESNNITVNENSGNALLFDGGNSRITVHDGQGNFNIKSGVDDSHNIINDNGGSHIELSENGGITLAISNNSTGTAFTDDTFLALGNGQINISDDLYVGGTIKGTKVYNAVYNDVAELFKINSNENFEPGDVIISKNGIANKTDNNSDKRVIGVYSDTYGYLLGGDEREGIEDYEGYIPIGISGRVNVKVIGPVEEGDLLTSSNIEGYAKKIKEYIPGTIIGKALESIKEGEKDRVKMLIMNN